MFAVAARETTPARRTLRSADQWVACCLLQLREDRVRRCNGLL